MNKVYLRLAAALLAAPLLVSIAQPAFAVVILVTGNFSVTISNAGSDSLSRETGSGLSNFTETLSNGNRTLTGSFSESLSLGSSYGFAEFFAINIPGGDPNLAITFTGLSDGTAGSCAGGCSYNTTYDNSGFAADTLTATFTDGNSLTINLADDHGTTIDGDIMLTLNGPTTHVPEPTSLALLGSALVGFGVIRRRRRKTV